MPSRGNKRAAKSAARGAIVTGGAAGIGAAISRCLERDGYLVCVVDVAGNAAVKGDVREAATAQKAVNWLVARGAPVKALVNCAGISLGGPLPRLTQEHWDATLGVDLTGAYVFIREVAPAMTSAGGGRIVNIASTAAVKGFKYTSAYCASKHALLGLTRALAVELAPKQVTVNAVCPGWTDTDMLSASAQAISKATGRTAEEARATLARMNPLGRLIQADEVAELCLYLASPAAAAITGAVLTVDGGETA